MAPGPLRLQGAIADDAPSTIVRTAFLEACVGETCAALEAAEAAERATDPVVRSVLRCIASDESRHAELGWRFVRWALETMGTEVRAVLEQELAQTMAAESKGADSMDG